MPVDMFGFGGTIKETRGEATPRFSQLVTTQSNVRSEGTRWVREPFSGALSQRAEQVEKVHGGAMRFSKLPVSEIKHHNNRHERRENNDLCERLENGAARSRQVFKKCFAERVAKQDDYFHEERVRTLAEDDLRLLGSGYPGPSV